jgi:hypothetical protein
MSTACDQLCRELGTGSFELDHSTIKMQKSQDLADVGRCTVPKRQVSPRSTDPLWILEDQVRVPRQRNGFLA